MENEMLFQKRIEIMIEMAVKRYDNTLKKYEQEVLGLKQEISSLREGLSSAKNELKSLRSEISQRPGAFNNPPISIQTRQPEKVQESILKTKNGNFSSEDVSIEKFFYVGGKG